jgi:hypothetical protein
MGAVWPRESTGAVVYATSTINLNAADMYKVDAYIVVLVRRTEKRHIVCVKVI